jgi:polyhydroxyalkanoate synthesis regulator phasin
LAADRTGPRGTNEIVRAIEELLAELPARVRGSRERIEESTVGTLRMLVRELGAVSRDEVDELELRVAQLEHRLRLLERREP